jgi:hypothetical protein
MRTSYPRYRRTQTILRTAKSHTNTVETLHSLVDPDPNREQGVARVPRRFGRRISKVLLEEVDLICKWGVN